MRIMRGQHFKNGEMNTKKSCTQYNKTQNHEQEIKATVKKIAAFFLVVSFAEHFLAEYTFYMIFGLLFKN